ncbi:MAG: response regulator [Mariprofundus sp.]|nr:response regulator [Mariprofundus sp.]
MIHSNATVLLVDDDKAVLKIHTFYLERMGYKVIAVSSGCAALAEFRRQPDLFDMLVSDFQMPGMNGLELIAEMRKLVPDLPVLMVSGYADDVLIHQLMAEKVKLATKPLTYSAFSSLMEQ